MGWKFYSVTSNKTRTAGEGDEEVYCEVEERVEEGGDRDQRGRRKGRKGGRMGR